MHSLKPWTVKAADAGGFFEVVDAGGDLVALVRRKDDAHLITAAPELLEVIDRRDDMPPLAQKAHGLLG